MSLLRQSFFHAIQLLSRHASEFKPSDCCCPSELATHSYLRWQASSPAIKTIQWVINSLNPPLSSLYGKQRLSNRLYKWWGTAQRPLERMRTRREQSIQMIALRIDGAMFRWSWGTIQSLGGLHSSLYMVCLVCSSPVITIVPSARIIFSTSPWQSLSSDGCRGHIPIFDMDFISPQAHCMLMYWHPQTLTVI